MAQTPPLRLYESTAAPNPAGTPGLRAPDQGSGIGPALMRAGQALGNAAQAVLTRREADVHIQQEAQRQAEDDGRIRAAQAMAQFRADASAMQRDVFDNAPNGYEGATHTAAARYTELAQQYLARPEIASSPDAARFLTQATGLFQPEFLDNTAAQEAHGRDQWQADSITQTIDTLQNDLIANPTHYEGARTEIIATLGSISNPNLRRDATLRAEQSLSASAISGMIQANPSQTLHMLQAHEAPDIVTRLSAAAREQAIHQAQAEIERRNSQWRTSVAQSVSTAQARWSLGLDAPSAPSFDGVYQALGPEAALQYETARLTGQSRSELSMMPTRDLMAIVSEAQNPAHAAHATVPGGRTTGQQVDTQQAVQQLARQRAAALILQERQQDPMQAQVRQGLVPQADLIGAVNQGNWQMVDGILANRAAAAEQNGRSLGMPALPLTAFEAHAIAPVIQNMDWRNRATILRNMRAWTGGGDAYTALMSQLFPNSPGSAYAGYIAGLSGAHGQTNADIILRGEDLLGGRNPTAPGANATGTGQGGQRANTPIVSLPPQDGPTGLRAVWARHVGDAFSGWAGQSPDSQAEEQAYQVFRAAYADLSYTAHDYAPAAADDNRVMNAIRVATGGITDWGGHRTIVPPGMTAGQFAAGVRAGFQHYEALRNVDPTHYALRPIGTTANGGGRYAVYLGDDPLMSAGVPVEIEVRR